MALLLLTQVGNTVSKRRKETSRKILTPGRTAKGQMRLLFVD